MIWIIIIAFIIIGVTVSLRLRSKSESSSPLFNESSITNYIIAIIAAVIYFMATHPNTSPLNLFGAFESITSFETFFFFIGIVMGILGISAIFAGIYYLVKRKGFSNILAWATVIMCVLSIIYR